MKIAVCFLYVLLSVLYLSIGDSSREWGAVNIITQIGFIGYLCYLAEQSKRNSVFERLFFGYMKYLSIANCIYIIWCVFKGAYWSIYNTDVFAYILGISFVILLIHVAILQHNENTK